MQVNHIHLSCKPTRGALKRKSKLLHYQSIFFCHVEGEKIITVSEQNINNFATSSYSWLITAGSKWKSFLFICQIYAKNIREKRWNIQNCRGIYEALISSVNQDWNIILYMCIVAGYRTRQIERQMHVCTSVDKQATIHTGAGPQNAKFQFCLIISSRPSWLQQRFWPSSPWIFLEKSSNLVIFSLQTGERRKGIAPDMTSPLGPDKELPVFGDPKHTAVTQNLHCGSELLAEQQGVV